MLSGEKNENIRGTVGGFFMRRRDREVTDFNEIIHILDSGKVLHLGGSGKAIHSSYELRLCYGK